MRSLPTRAGLLLALVLPGGALLGTQPSMSSPDATQLESMLSRFAPVDLEVDLSGLPPNERRALGSLVAAARLVDGLFLRQVWPGNDAMLLELAQDPTPLGRARLRYFVLNKGPWSRLDHHAPFVPGAPPKPGGASFYPPDASKAEIERWLDTLDGPARERASSFFTVIRRGPAGDLTPVPYSREYAPELALLSAALREAAGHTSQPTLQRFLRARAEAFQSNDYYESDVAWMELDASIEPTIGPYEVYEDEWFNYKAAFEAFITLRDEAESSKLARFGAELQGLEDALPIDPRYRNSKLGGLAPIAVVNVVFAAGDGNHDVQTAAFNLPNDERVVAAKGSKRVMLKNVQEAKFAKVLQPIARVALAPADQPRVAFDAFFTHILMHELMHGLGPQAIAVRGRATTVRQELKDTYSAIEEAKADVSGLWALQRLIDTGRLDRRFEDTMYVTFVASAFRSIRFGVNEAHGRGVAIQINRFLDAGALEPRSDGTFDVRVDAMKRAVTDLTRDLMTLQAEGDYAGTRALIDRFAVVRPEVQRLLDRLTEVPVDIAPRFVTAETFERE
jgi:hypothetical protein